MHEPTQAELLLQLSNIELYVALYGVLLGGLFAVDASGAKRDHTVLIAWRVTAALCGVIALFLVIWLGSALIIRWGILVGLE
jgi:hypothetical protein